MDDDLSGELELCSSTMEKEIKGMVKLILPRIKENASVRITLPSTFVVDGVKPLRIWRSALLARRQYITTSTPLRLQGAVSGGSRFADQVGMPRVDPEN